MLLFMLLSMALVRKFKDVEPKAALKTFVASNNSLFFHQCHEALGKIVLFQPYRQTFDIVDMHDMVCIILPCVLL